MEVWLALATDYDGIQRVYGFTKEDDARRFAASVPDRRYDWDVMPLTLDSQEYV